MAHHAAVGAAWDRIPLNIRALEPGYNTDSTTIWWQRKCGQNAEEKNTASNATQRDRKIRRQHNTVGDMSVSPKTHVRKP